jgi:uncharacterized membrane protein
MQEPPVLPDHVQATIEAIGELHRRHHRRTTPTQRMVTRLTNLAARPRFVGGLTLALMLWIGGNAALQLKGWPAPDPAPFNGLQMFAAILGVYVTLLILITQRRENELSEARDQLTLELAILNEQKSAKIIALLEESRRDNPMMPDRHDQEAVHMSSPADPQAVLDALRDATGEMTGALSGDESRGALKPDLAARDEFPRSGVDTTAAGQTLED